MKTEDKSSNNIYAEQKKLLGKRLAELRSHRKMSQLDLAVAMGVTPGYIGDIERGVINITLETIIRILLALKAQPADLIPNPNLSTDSGSAAL
jgi:transcriptional regulator with XRE-family HTH domain